MPTKKTAAKKTTKTTAPKTQKAKVKKPAIKPVSEFPLLPLRDVVIFPGMIMPLFVGRPKSVAALEAGMQGNKQIILTAQKKMETDEPKAGELYSVGTLINIMQMLKLPDGSIKVLVEGVGRVRIKSMAAEEPFFRHRTDPTDQRLRGGSDGDGAPRPRPV